MHIQVTPLKPLSSIELTAEENTLLKWLRSVSWEPVQDARAPIPYKAKVPEFYGGVRMYRVQAGGTSGNAMGALELFIKKLGLQGVIGKPDMYPVTGHGSQPRYVCLKKADLDNLRQAVDEDM